MLVPSGVLMMSSPPEEASACCLSFHQYILHPVAAITWVKYTSDFVFLLRYPYGGPLPTELSPGL